MTGWAGSIVNVAEAPRVLSPALAVAVTVQVPTALIVTLPDSGSTVQPPDPPNLTGAPLEAAAVALNGASPHRFVEILLDGQSRGRRGRGGDGPTLSEAAADAAGDGPTLSEAASAEA